MIGTLVAGLPYVLPMIFISSPGTSFAVRNPDSHEVAAPWLFEQLSEGTSDKTEPQAAHVQPEDGLSESFTSKTVVSAASSRQVGSQIAPWADQAIVSLRAQSPKHDGDLLDEAVETQTAALEDAVELISHLAIELPDVSRPMISIDEDGYVCLFWVDEDAMASMTSYGDATYSFFATDGVREIRSNEEPLGAPLPPKLMHLLASGIFEKRTLAA